MFLRRICLYFVWFMFLTSAATAQQSARIEGTVRDAAGAIYPGAVVHIMEWRLDALRHASVVREQSIACDSKGHYAFVVSPGIYDVSIGAVDHLPADKRFHVVEGKTYDFGPSLQWDPSADVVE